MSVNCNGSLNGGCRFQPITIRGVVMGTYNCFKTTKGYECLGLDPQGNKLVHTTHGSAGSAYMECLAWEGRGFVPTG